MPKPLLILYLSMCTIVCAFSAHSHPGARSTIDHFSHKLEREPKSQALHIQRGIAYSADGQFDNALADLQKASTLGDPVLVSFDLGVLHYRKGEFEEALRHFDQYLERFPQHSACLEYRARLRRDKGDHEGAIADFLQVFELEKSPNPGHYISVARMLAEDERVLEALKVLDEGNSKLGLTPQLQFVAIGLEEQRNRIDRAIERLQALHPILGESADWKVQMGALQHGNNNPKQGNALLLAAKKQLGELRRTPARIALLERIAKTAIAIRSLRKHLQNKMLQERSNKGVTLN